MVVVVVAAAAADGGAAASKISMLQSLASSFLLLDRQPAVHGGPVVTYLSVCSPA